jgi:hypothetical protein
MDRTCTGLIWQHLMMVGGFGTDLLIKVVRLFIPSAVAAMVTRLCNFSSWQVSLSKMQVQSSIYAP